MTMDLSSKELGWDMLCAYIAEAYTPEHLVELLEVSSEDIIKAFPDMMRTHSWKFREFEESILHDLYTTYEISIEDEE